MKINNAGLAILKKWEGFRSKPYVCPAGKWTIGYGCTYLADGTPVAEHTPEIPVDAANELLADVLVRYETCVMHGINVAMSPNQFSAMVCLAYNIGTTAFAASSVVKRMNEGNVIGAADAFLMWNKIRDDKGFLQVSKGLTSRRNDERSLFLS